MQNPLPLPKVAPGPPVPMKQAPMKQQAALLQLG